MSLYNLNEQGVKIGLENCASVGRYLNVAEQRAQEAVDRATEELNAIRSLKGFVASVRDTLRHRLNLLEEGK